MKVIHFHPDGRMAARFVDPLVIAERAAGIESSLITSFRNSATSEREIPFDVSPSSLWLLPINLMRICKLIAGREPDVVVSHNTKSSPVPLLAAWLMGVSTRVYFNHGVPYLGYTGVLRWTMRNFERFNCALATKVVTVSDDMIRALRAVQKRIEPVLVLRGSACGVELSDYDRGKFRNSTWRQSQGLTPQDLVFVFVGRPLRRKGFECVLRLWADYLDEPHLKLVLCGPSQADVLRCLPSIPRNVVPLGFVDNVPEILANADGLILPSFHEGLSYAVLEAMASMTAVIANDIDGNRNLVENGLNGYLIEGNELGKYAALLRSMAADRALIDNVLEPALATAREFSRDAFLRAYLRFFQEAVPAHREP